MLINVGTSKISGVALLKNVHDFQRYRVYRVHRVASFEMPFICFILYYSVSLNSVSSFT